jgi:hypothetical protein
VVVRVLLRDRTRTRQQLEVLGHWSAPFQKDVPGKVGLPGTGIRAIAHYSIAQLCDNGRILIPTIAFTIYISLPRPILCMGAQGGTYRLDLAVRGRVPGELSAIVVQLPNNHPVFPRVQVTRSASGGC